MRTTKRGCGPYTVRDLHTLPEDGKSYELEDGWLVELVRGARHNHVTQRLARFLDVGADHAVHVCVGGGWAITTPGGVRRPDIVVVPRDVVRAAVVAGPPRVIPGEAVHLAVEVIAPGTGSERTDRVRKVREYAAVGIQHYWIVEHHPDVRIHPFVLDGEMYRSAPSVGAGATLDTKIGRDNHFRVTVHPAALLEV
ncbi:Uma2 family endonuclease [Nocardia puris]|uniref:Putative restriction endonuclease n=1 Tax=Nocardia puris TaxID=208602 RepID=A0A366E3E1_9NOCA|nr:Uma2 family endonuclease [Nocardia puris]MBF6214448.1 Uma2 family endonuclease [Nocardia puris]MBF6369063.1 Uma2 family endonuclease [Nocardia puris]MBF6462789.1 Uma2 family endonuclease [Nocardia puris]RBO96832.1 putative restriction endonuclease [Nocardia puris]